MVYRGKPDLSGQVRDGGKIVKAPVVPAGHTRRPSQRVGFLNHPGSSRLQDTKNFGAMSGQLLLGNVTNHANVRDEREGLIAPGQAGAVRLPAVEDDWSVP